MTSTPILGARPSVIGLVSPKVGSAARFPVKSILREPSARTTALEYSTACLKRKMGDRYESDRQHGADKKRRVATDDSDEETNVEAVEDDLESDQESAMLNTNANANGQATGFARNEEDTDATDATGDGENGTPVVAKRQKTVHFDMNLNMTAEVGRRTIEETKLLVRRALDSHAVAGRPGHDDQDFIELVDVFSHDNEPYRDPRRSRRHGSADDDEDEGNTVPPDELVLYVAALTTAAPLLNKSCINLVRKMLACSWVGRDERFFRAFVQFLASLISAQGVYLRPVLEMFADRFKLPSASSWTVPDFPTVSREAVQKRLHFGLKHILRLFPAARMAMSKMVANKFPFPSESKNVHMFYVDNLLRLREYSPSIGLEILETITSQLVKIDTEFQLDLTDMDDDLAAKVVMELARRNAEREAANARHRLRDDSDLDDSDDSDPDSDVDEDDDRSHRHGEYDTDSEADDTDMPQFGDPDYNEELARIDRSTLLVEKLDSTLDRLFALFSPVFEDPDSEAAHRCLEDMLSDFANFVLTVPSSRHTQFLVFHFSQKSLALQDIFTGTLLNLGFESNRPAAVRQAATAYLSSYVARAARVPRDTVRNVANILCHRIESYRWRNVGSCRGPDLRRYQELYSWVQALLYIFCFRWRDLIDGYPADLVDPDDPSSYVGKDLEWMSGLRTSLSNIIYSKLNPLMVCSPPIVAEYAKLAHTLQFMYVFPRIESNKSMHLSQFASGRYGHGDALREDAGYTVDDEKWLQLEGNFPFDPYNLPASKRWLEGDYVSWTPITGGDDSSSDSDDSDDDGVDNMFDS